MSTNMSVSVETFHNNIAEIATGLECSVSSGGKTINIEVFGTATSINVVVESQIVNQSNWYEIAACNTKSLEISSHITTNNSVWQVDLTACSKIRCRITSISGGNLTVLGRIVN